MSETNRRQAERTARERLRAEREREKIRARRRRTAVVAGGIAAFLVAAGAVGVLVADRGRSTAGGPAAAPSGATGKADLAVPVGAAGAPATLTVYEDFRCPACDAFERTYRPTLHRLEDSGRLKGEYHLVRLIDGNLGGTGSLTAANAAACAQAAGDFRAFHDVLYDNQPDEQQDRFSDTGYLLRLAGKVSGLRTPAFTSCVRSGRYDAWVNKSAKEFDAAGFGSTPTVLLNGRNIYDDRAHPLTPARLERLVDQADRGKPSASPAPRSG